MRVRVRRTGILHVYENVLIPDGNGGKTPHTAVVSTPVVTVEELLRLRPEEKIEDLQRELRRQME